jgi:hypothetical protein
VVNEKDDSKNSLKKGEGKEDSTIKRDTASIVKQNKMNKLVGLPRCRRDAFSGQTKLCISGRGARLFNEH